MDPTELPEEVAERILMLLTPEDLLACSLVNSSWRNAVNNNRIWKRYCNPAMKLENEISYVSPTFEIPSTCETIGPLCEYRVSFMREMHVKKNFVRGRYVEFKCPRGNFLEDVEFFDRYLFMNDSVKNSFHMWDIEGEPCLVQTFRYSLQNMGTTTFRALEDGLLIVQCNLVQMYRIVDEILTLDFCRVFDREEDFSLMIPTSDDLTSWYSSIVGLFPCDFNSINDTVGDYFIGLVEPDCLNDSVMHIWNIKTGKKLKHVMIPRVEESVDTICTGRNSENVFIALYLRRQSWGGMCLKMFSFNLKSLEYTNFYVESDNSIPFMLFEDKITLLPCDQWKDSGSYRFLDSISGKDIATKSFEHPMNPKALDVRESIMAFGSGSTVTLVDIDKIEDINTIDVEMEVKEVFFQDARILLVGGIVIKDLTSSVQVWDVERYQKLYTVKDRSISFCGQTLPRISFLSMYYIHILHFW